MSLYMDESSETELTYEEIKPFKCSKCRNSFIALSDLQFHRELVHSKGFFQCSKCDFSCRGIGQITLHNQNHVRESMQLLENKTSVRIFHPNYNNQLPNTSRNENDNIQEYSSNTDEDNKNANSIGNNYLRNLNKDKLNCTSSRNDSVINHLIENRKLNKLVKYKSNATYNSNANKKLLENVAYSEIVDSIFVDHAPFYIQDIEPFSQIFPIYI